MQIFLKIFSRLRIFYIGVCEKIIVALIVLQRKPYINVYLPLLLRMSFDYLLF